MDGPWWGAREAAHLRQLGGLLAASHGVELDDDDLAIEWTVGPGPPPAALLPAADGLAAFAARHGLVVNAEPGTRNPE